MVATKQKTKTKNNDEEISQKLLEVLKKGQKPWIKPWKEGGYANLLTKHPYKGGNIFLCNLDVIANNYSSNFFIGMGQARSMNWWIRKGSKATKLFWFSHKFCGYHKDVNGDRLQDENGEPVPMYRPTFKWFNVFNIDVVDDSKSSTKIKDYIPRQQNEPVPLFEEAEEFISAQEADIREEGSRACYFPILDRIYVPPRERFLSAEGRYATLVHELTHWTGHKTRLNRKIADGSGSFDKRQYAFEELIAEIGSALVCQEFNIASDLENHGNYLQSWIKLLEDKEASFFSALRKAQQAKNYLLSR